MSDETQPLSREETARGEMLKRIQAEEEHLRAEVRRKHEETLARLEIHDQLRDEVLQMRAQMRGSAAQPVVINNIIQNNLVAHRASLGFLIRTLYFLFIGWWFGFLWLGAALALCVTIIGLPIAILMFSKSIEAFFLW